MPPAVAAEETSRAEASLSTSRLVSMASWAADGPLELEEVDAGIVGLGGEPDAGSEDGDGEEHGGGAGEAFQRLPLPYVNDEFRIDSILKDFIANENEPAPYIHIRRKRDALGCYSACLATLAEQHPHREIETMACR
ncbi:hypothetical protein Taro_036199 [Colocasia esculenta]|uniref:Uncharacterized protein n=1 Tax=Colocasia esculenta TaxID=4460 RepID=A0A843WKY7_COLES|nr:hypothetical protein [Colocasia esculenta]